MKLSAPLLTSLSLCERRFQLEREYRVVRRSPREVFNELFQEALLCMSGGLPANRAAEEMSACLMEHAAHHGFDTLHDPYTLTRDLCAVAHTALERISREAGLDLGRPAPRAGWKFSCLANSRGTALERWIAVESWDETEPYRQMHSWYVYGDCCAARKPMRIHAIELGPLRRGHYHCDWARCFAHPALLNIYRFRKQDGSKLESSWKPMWLKDLREKHVKDWVDRMERDGVDRIPTLSVSQPTAADLDRFDRELEHYRVVISAAIKPKILLDVKTGFLIRYGRGSRCFITLDARYLRTTQDCRARCRSKWRTGDTFLSLSPFDYPADVMAARDRSIDFLDITVTRVLDEKTALVYNGLG